MPMPTDLRVWSVVCPVLVGPLCALRWYRLATGIYLLATCLFPGFVVPHLFKLSRSQIEFWRWLTRRIFLPTGTVLWFSAFAHHGLYDVRHGGSSVHVKPFWGPVTAGIDWCETNYHGSPYVAELWNTTTNLWMLMQGLIGAIGCIRGRHPARFGIAYILLSVIGFGSGLFHAFMTRPSQLGDEVPMIWLLIALLYIFYIDSYGSEARPFLGVAGVMYGILCSAANIWSSNPLIFQVPFFALTFVMILARFQKAPDDRTEDVLLQLAWTCLFVASCAWTLERLSCSFLPFVEVLHLHSWWHIFVGMGVHMHVQSLLASSQRHNTSHKSPTPVEFALFDTMPMVVGC